MRKGIVFLALIAAVSMMFRCSPKVDGEASVQSVSIICGSGSTGLAC